MEEFEHVISEVVLVPGTGGVFEIEVDGELLYSKKATGRHIEPDDVLALLRKR